MSNSIDAAGSLAAGNGEVGVAVSGAADSHGGQLATAHAGDAPVEFARSLLRAAARPERIASVVAEIIGDHVASGPIRVGPARLAVARAEGWPGMVRAMECEAEGWDVGVEVPIVLRLRLDVVGVVARFAAAATVRMRIALVPEDPCALVIRTEEVGEEHIDLEVLALDAVARVIHRFGDVRGTVGAHILGHLRGVLAGPRVRAVRRIDVAEVIDRAWEAGLVAPPVVDDGQAPPVRDPLESRVIDAPDTGEPGGDGRGGARFGWRAESMPATEPVGGGARPGDRQPGSGRLRWARRGA